MLPRKAVVAASGIGYHGSPHCGIELCEEEVTMAKGNNSRKKETKKPKKDKDKDKKKK